VDRNSRNIYPIGIIAIHIGVQTDKNGNRLNQPDRICLIPHLTGVGGPAVFQRKLVSGLQDRGIEAVYNLADRPYRAVLVIGGTRQLGRLWQTRREKTPIIQRLDGMNWIHKRRPTGLKHYLRAEYGNLNLNVVRRRIASQIVYQSEFAQKWWEQEKSRLTTPARVIYNGVDLQKFTPDGPANRPDDYWRILVVEGNLAGGYEAGLENAVGLAEKLNNLTDNPVELLIAGIVPDAVKSELDEKAGVRIAWAGHLPQTEIPALDRSAHLLFSADINAACPNSVIEALGSGLPVLALNSGALPELVKKNSGIIVPYGGSPWKLDPPDLDGLALAGLAILNNQSEYRAGARARAEEMFGIDQMVERYLEVLI
jgi:glycosyltransferase involved in cell wall biosynthesis